MIVPDDILEPMTLKEQYFDVKGLKAYSGMGETTLRGYIKSGELPAFRVGGKIFVRRSEFDQWIEQYRVPSSLDAIVDKVMSSFD